MGRIFKEDSCEAAILVDVDNASNQLNRKVAQNDMQHQCPPIFKISVQYLNERSKLHLGDR